MVPTHMEGDDRLGLGSLSTVGADVKVGVWPVQQQAGQDNRTCISIGYFFGSILCHLCGIGLSACNSVDYCENYNIN